MTIARLIMSSMRRVMGDSLIFRNRFEFYRIIYYCLYLAKSAFFFAYLSLYPQSHSPLCSFK